mgnify:CR=1 FL=1
MRKKDSIIFLPFLKVYTPNIDKCKDLQYIGVNEYIFGVGAMFEPLTKRQGDILEYIRQQIDNHQMVPSLMEIGHRFRISSPNGVRSHVLALEKKGYIKRPADKARSIQLMTPAPGLIARLVTSAKRKLWEKQNYYYYLPIFIGLSTCKGYPLFVGKYATDLEKKIRSVASNHSWEILELKIEPDRVTFGVIASPDHSVERIVRNLKNCTLTMQMKHPIYFHGKNVWASGFAASTDRRMLNELAERHRAGAAGSEGQ